MSDRELDRELWNELIEDIKLRQQMWLGKRLLSNPKRKKILLQEVAKELQKQFGFRPSQAREMAQVVAEEILKLGAKK